MTTCNKCQEGRYGQFPGEVNRSCTGLCPPNMKEGCTAGTASPKLPKVGHYLANISTKLLKKCPAGKYKATLDFSGCITCAHGQFQNEAGKAFCNQGRRSTYIRGNSEHQACPRGLCLVDEARCEFGELSYVDGFWVSGEWTLGNPSYSIRVTVNGVEVHASIQTASRVNHRTAKVLFPPARLPWLGRLPFLALAIWHASPPDRPYPYIII